MKLEFETYVYRNQKKEDADRKVADIVGKIELFCTQLGMSAIDPKGEGSCIYVDYICESPCDAGQITYQNVLAVAKRWAQGLVNYAANFPDECTEDDSVELGSEDDLASKHYRIVIADDDSVGALIVTGFDEREKDTFERLVFIPLTARESDRMSTPLGDDWYDDPRK